jgi:zinc finger protein ZFPM1
LEPLTYYLFYLFSIVKLEPHDDKSNDVEIIVDEPEIQIKTELPERPNSVTPTLRPQSRPNSQPNHRSNSSTASSVSPVSSLRHASMLQQSHEISTSQPPPAPLPSPGIDNGGANHCKTCDIKFNYVNTFLAHKKFYCKSLINDELGEVVNAPQSASATNVRVTETTVL